MRKSILILALISSAALTACLDNDAERAVAGGLAGAVIADSTGGNATAGAAVGAAAGALCDDAGICN